MIVLIRLLRHFFFNNKNRLLPVSINKPDCCFPSTMLCMYLISSGKCRFACLFRSGYRNYGKQFCKCYYCLSGSTDKYCTPE